MITYNEALGLAIRKLRREKHMTLRKVGKLSDITEQRINAIELGSPHQPVLKTIVAVARALDVQPSYLMLEAERIMIDAVL